MWPYSIFFQNFGSKSIFSYFLFKKCVKTLKFGRKIQQKNSNFGQKLKFWSEIKIVVKN